MTISSYEQSFEYTKTFKYAGNTAADIPTNIDVVFNAVKQGEKVNFPKPAVAQKIFSQGNRQARKNAHRKAKRDMIARS